MTKKIEIKPRGLWVLVSPIEEDSKETESGLLLPTTEEKEQKAQGIVESIGEEVKNIKVGDRVVYGAYAGEVLKVNEEDGEKEYKLLLDEDIIAFVK